MSCPPCPRRPSNVSRALLIVAFGWLAGCQAPPQRVFRDVRPGAELRVPSEPGLVYQVAATPGGAHACSLFVLDAQGCEHGAAVHVYVNDPNADRDGDGLGRELERALRTCDAPSDVGCEHSPLQDRSR